MVSSPSKVIPTGIRSGSGTALPQKRCKWVVNAYYFKRVLIKISPGTLPSAQNNPQKAKYDLYTESVSVSSSYNRCTLTEICATDQRYTFPDTSKG